MASHRKSVCQHPQDLDILSVEPEKFTALFGTECGEGGIFQGHDRGYFVMNQLFAFSVSQIRLSLPPVSSHR